jgi:hypothetical protein
MDFILPFIGGSLIWGLSMAIKEKIGVAVAMSMGVLSSGFHSHPVSRFMTSGHLLIDRNRFQGWRRRCRQDGHASQPVQPR